MVEEGDVLLAMGTRVQLEVQSEWTERMDGLLPAGVVEVQFPTSFREHLRTEAHRLRHQVALLVVPCYNYLNSHLLQFSENRETLSIHGLDEERIPFLSTTDTPVNRENMSRRSFSDGS